MNCIVHADQLYLSQTCSTVSRGNVAVFSHTVRCWSA